MKSGSVESSFLFIFNTALKSFIIKYGSAPWTCGWTLDIFMEEVIIFFIFLKSLLYYLRRGDGMDTRGEVGQTFPPVENITDRQTNK